MALKKVRGNLERMFDKNLTDLVRGIRNNKDNEVKSYSTFYPVKCNILLTIAGFLQTKYIAQCIEEIKQELRQENMSVKATAVAKLTYVRIFICIISS